MPVVLGALLGACQPTPATPTGGSAQPQANPLVVRTTPGQVSLQPDGSWSAVVTLDASGGQPPYTFQSTWPSAGSGVYNVSAVWCQPVRFSAVVTSADAQERSVDVQFRPTACAGAAVATPAPGAAAPTPAPTAAPTSSAPPAGEAGAEARLLDLVNALRAEKGLPAYRLNDALTAAALRQAQDMAARQNFSNHTGSDGSTPQQRIREAGYTGNLVSENIFGGQATIDDAWGFWSTDQFHLPNLISAQFTDTGIAVVRQGNFTYYVQTFGGP
jgi:uncharacterized protein YkwD